MEILFWRQSTPSQKKKEMCTLYLRITVNESSLGQQESRFLLITGSNMDKELPKGSPCGYAKSKKLIDFDPLDAYPIGREKIPKPKYLNSVQLRIWIDHPFVSPTAQKVADVFVLYARTGFHYQDLAQVVKKPNAYIMTGIDGKQWFTKPRQKRDVDAKIPIDQFTEIQEIVDKYGGWANIPMMSNSPLNDWLKICVADINMHLMPEQRIYGDLSVKHGRSSFADYCLNELGLPMAAILTMMGRESEAEIKRYLRTD